MGKSTLAKLVTDRPLIGTDNYQGMEWEEIPLRMIADVAPLSSFAIEGVMVARALRKGMAVDAVIYLQRPKVADRLPGQVAMAKGIKTVFDQWHAANRDIPVFFESPR